MLSCFFAAVPALMPVIFVVPALIFSSSSFCTASPCEIIALPLDSASAIFCAVFSCFFETSKHSPYWSHVASAPPLSFSCRADFSQSIAKLETYVTIYLCSCKSLRISIFYFSFMFSSIFLSSLAFICFYNDLAFNYFLRSSI